MINPISNAHASEPVPQAPPSRPEHPAQAPPETVKSGTVSRDQVTLKSAGQVDSDNK